MGDQNKTSLTKIHYTVKHTILKQLEVAIKSAWSSGGGIQNLIYILIYISPLASLWGVLWVNCTCWICALKVWLAMATYLSKLVNSLVDRAIILDSVSSLLRAPLIFEEVKVHWTFKFFLINPHSKLFTFKKHTSMKNWHGSHFGVFVYKSVQNNWPHCHHY